jgi:hypothetical protein
VVLAGVVLVGVVLVGVVLAGVVLTGVVLVRAAPYHRPLKPHDEGTPVASWGLQPPRSDGIPGEPGIPTTPDDSRRPPAGRPARFPA